MSNKPRKIKKKSQEKPRKIQEKPSNKGVCRSFSLHSICHVHRLVRVMAEHSCPPRGGLMQGWESQLPGVGDYLN